MTYRNNHNIRQLLLCRIKHFGSTYISTSEDHELPPHCLPPGGKPVWVERTQEGGDTEVLEYVKTIVTVGHSVTTLYYTEQYSEIARTWCDNHGHY